MTNKIQCPHCKHEIKRRAKTSFVLCASCRKGFKLKGETTEDVTKTEQSSVSPHIQQ